MHLQIVIPVAANDKRHPQKEIDHHFLHWQARLKMLLHPLAALKSLALLRRLAQCCVASIFTATGVSNTW